MLLYNIVNYQIVCCEAVW